MVLIVGIGLGLLMGAIGKAAARYRDSLKGSAAAAMYAEKPFKLAVSAWLREPALPRKQAWRRGRLRITDARLSWRPNTPFSKPTDLTRSVIIRERPSSWRGTVDLPLSAAGVSRLLILVVQAGNREVELALPRPNVEIIIHGITQAGHSLAAQPAQSGTEAPTTPDT
jgi:hypothetical protein